MHGAIPSARCSHAADLYREHQKTADESTISTMTPKDFIKDRGVWQHERSHEARNDRHARARRAIRRTWGFPVITRALKTS